MNRRSFLIGAGAALLVPAVLRPSDLGGPYSRYFSDLNRELQRRGPGRPVMILDLDRVDRNLAAITASIGSAKAYRVVVKSLPSVPLLRYVMTRTGTTRLMAFHGPFLSDVAESLPTADVLLGKPLPVAAVREFFRRLGHGAFDADRQVQWLIDSPERLTQYRHLARDLGRRLRVSIELDVGDHRGNVRDVAGLDRLLGMISRDPQHLQLAGFMGYDAHISGFPSAWRERLHANVLHRYAEFVDFGRGRYPDLFRSPLTLNGAGSRTLSLYRQDALLNDLSAGSGVVKPTDFDTDLLENHIAACFIATPVLKRRSSLDIPVAPWIGYLDSWWNPNRRQSFFLYGGFWNARLESPPGLVSNPFYGRSSNSEMVNGSSLVPLGVDDYVFLRPAQSESVMLQFGDLLCVREGRIVDEWPVLSQTS